MIKTPPIAIQIHDSVLLPKHPERYFDTIGLASQLFKSCPLCKMSFDMESSERYLDLLDFNTSIKLSLDSRNIEAGNSIIMPSEMYFPINFYCDKCENFSYSIRVKLNILYKLIEEIYLNRIMIKNNDIEINSVYNPETTIIILNEKEYKVDFIDLLKKSPKQVLKNIKSMVPFL